MKQNIIKILLGITFLSGLLGLYCLYKNIDKEVDLEENDLNEKIAEKIDEKVEEKLDIKIDEQIKDKLDKVVQERDQLINLLGRQQLRNRDRNIGDMLCYYGCPNSKRIQRLGLSKSRQKIEK